MCYFYYHFHLLKSYYTAEQALYRYIIELYIVYIELFPFMQVSFFAKKVFVLWLLYVHTNWMYVSWKDIQPTSLFWCCSSVSCCLPHFDGHYEWTWIRSRFCQLSEDWLMDSRTMTHLHCIGLTLHQMFSAVVTVVKDTITKHAADIVMCTFVQ